MIYPPEGPTAIRCPDKRFRTARYARKWAWGLHANPEQRPVPYQCDDCGAWHLRAAETTEIEEK